jgi:formylglycine-generating enzyme required for sulfatase activity
LSYNYFIKILGEDFMQAGNRIVDAQGVIMVYVPSGTFMMGRREADAEAAFQERYEETRKYSPRDVSDMQREPYMIAMPQHEVRITKAFWIDILPVSNAAFTQFKDDGGYLKKELWTEAGWEWSQKYKNHLPRNHSTSETPNYPRVGVSWYEVYAYCRWRKGQLPSEAQWEWALRGPESRIYPWGNTMDLSRVTLKPGLSDIPLEIGENIRSTGASWVGALDMVGNVVEWTNSSYKDYPYSEEDGREDPADRKTERVQRSWSTWSRLYKSEELGVANNLASSSRYGVKPKTENYKTGFRCIRLAEE